MWVSWFCTVWTQQQSYSWYTFLTWRQEAVYQMQPLTWKRSRQIGKHGFWFFFSTFQEHNEFVKAFVKVKHCYQYAVHILCTVVARSSSAGHFRVGFSLICRGRLSAKPLIWKMSFHAGVSDDHSTHHLCSYISLLNRKGWKLREQDWFENLKFMLKVLIQTAFRVIWKGDQPS